MEPVGVGIMRISTNYAQQSPRMLLNCVDWAGQIEMGDVAQSEKQQFAYMLSSENAIE